MLAMKSLSRPTSRRADRTLMSHVASETLEDRIVLSAASAIAPAVAPTSGALADAINVESVQRVGDQLQATLNVFGQTQTLLMDVGTLENGSCDILTLALGPVSLDVLGLNVDLYNCDNPDEPIVVEITGETGDGNLLGNLVCGLTGLLDNGLSLEEALGQLDLDGVTNEAGTLLSGLTSVLNSVFDSLLGGGSGDDGDLAAASHGGGPGAGVTDILSLEVAPLHLDVLGLVVDTTAICLDVTAESGSGNLLGNLLGSIAHLLDNDPGNAIAAKLDKIESILSSISDDLLEGGNQGQGRGRGR